jgi:hypothetical protein
MTVQLSSQRRLIVIYWDVVNKCHRDSSGAKVRSDQYPFINYREKPIVNLYLVTDDSLTSYSELNATYNFTAAIDDDFDHSTGLMCKTEDDEINVTGDWEGDSANTPSTAAGEFSILLNADTSEYDSKIASLSEKAGTKLEVHCYDSTSGDLWAVFRMPFRCLNIIDDDSATPTARLSNFEWYTNGDGKQCLRIKNDAGEVLTELDPIGL